jgi:Leucine-rich repeat (LRR) protein
MRALNMEPVEAYREAKWCIESARRKGATTLDLSWIGLTEVPEEIASLTRLKELYLSHNQLTSFPEEIASLTQLTELDLSINQLTSVSEATTTKAVTGKMAFY